MATRRPTPLVALLVGALAGLLGCGGGSDAASTSTTAAGPGASGCDDAVAQIVDATSRYIRGYESGQAVSASPDGSAPVEPTSTTTAAEAPLSDADFQQALVDGETALRTRACDPVTVRGDLTAGLGAVPTEGPVADAVLRQLTASLTGQIPAQPGVISVAAGDDLRQALATAPDGSTLELGPGEHHVDTSLVLLNGIVLRGAGRDATTIVSTAPDAAVLLVTDQPISLQGLTIRHEGAEAGSAVLGGPAVSLAVSDARLTGGRVDSAGQGGAGLLLFGEVTQSAGRGTTLEITDTEVVGNESGGIVMTGGHRASIVRATATANGQCGICFVGASGGSVEDSSFDGNGIGIAITGTGQPALLRLTIGGGQVGVQAADDAAPTIQDVTITGAAQAAVIYGDRSGGSLDRLSCVEVPFGIVVSPEAVPQIGDTDCDLASTG